MTPMPARIVYFVGLFILLFAIIYAAQHGMAVYGLIAFFVWILGFGIYYAMRKP